MTTKTAAHHYSWYRLFTLFWVWIIGIQWLSFTEAYWFERTSTIAFYSLLSVAIVECLLPIRRMYRWLIEGCIILFIIHDVLVSRRIYVPYGTVSERIAQYIDNMSPYIWFALSVGVLYLIITEFFNSQRKILWLASVNIVSFAVLDSFTAVKLWDEMAWSMLALLGWLISEHLHRFMKRYPKGWQQLIRRPIRILLHIGLILSLIMLISINMPGVRPILTDPYTAWQERQENNASGSGLKDEDKPALASSSSGYSREDQSLGGGFEFDYSPVMMITTPMRSYWRGEVRMTYTGSGWETPISSSREFDQVSADQSLQNPDQSSIVPSQQLKQSVTMLDNGQYPVLFGAYSISEVQLVDGEKDNFHLSWKRNQSELHWDNISDDIRYPKTYTITSEIPVVPIDKLQQASYKDLYSEEIDDQYIQIPANFPDRILELAEEITQDSDHPYEKVALLQQYLLQNYAYTNGPDLSRSKSSDFVDTFLFEVKEGYCDYYSTAMVMLARSLDIPARWVKGYAPGHIADSTEMMMLQGRNVESEYIVTNADAHSWAEVYFGPYGWIPVEATPGFNMPLLTELSEDSFLDEPVDEQDQETAEDKTTEASASNSSSATIIKILGVAALLFVVSYAVFQAWRWRHQLHHWLKGLRLGGQLTPDQKVIVETERWMLYLKRKGLTRSDSETLRESVQRWRQEDPLLESPLQALLQLFEQAKYSPEAVTDEAWKDVQDYTFLLKQAMKTK